MSVKTDSVAHTPGPWKKEGLTICTSQGDIARIPVPNDGGVFDCQENACLIAAAPDMLDALKAAQEELCLIRMKDSDVVYDSTLRVKMSAAIRKAEGE